MQDLDAQTAYFAGPAETPRFTQDGDVVAWPVISGEAGVTMRLACRWSLVPAYKFEHLLVTGSALAYNASVFRLGLRRSF